MKTMKYWLMVIGMCALLTGCMNKIESKFPEVPELESEVTATPTMIPTATPTMIPTATPTTVVTPSSAVTPTLTLTVTPTVEPVPTAGVLPSPTEALVVTPVPLLERTNGEVYFSKVNHFISGDTAIEIRTDSVKEGFITYTLDGTEPKKYSELYKNPIQLEAGAEDAPNCYTIKAKAWYEDGTESESYVQTYFVAEKVAERYSTYILSVNGEPGELTEGPDGILYKENAQNRGRDYERKVHLELISSDGETVFTQYGGIRAHGGDSRKHAIKPFKIYARKEYQNGKGSFIFDGFGTLTLDGSAVVEKYDKMILRDGGDDYQQSGLREELVHRLAREAGFAAYEEVVPVVVYMNGKYYGFFWMHEAYCDKYFQQRNGKSDGEYVVLEGSDKQKWGANDEIERQAEAEYNSMYSRYSAADLTDEATYEALNTLIDVENYLDYMSYNIYIGNNDWPYNNYRCFRYYAEDGVYGNGEQDGRWRYLLHDADVAFSCYYASSATAFAERENLYEVIADEDGGCYSPLLAALLKREDCRQYFLDRMDFYMEEAVTPEQVNIMLDELMTACDGEIPYYYQYLEELKKTESTIWTSLGHREKSIATIRLFAELRPEYMRKQLAELLGYSGETDAGETE